MTFSPVCLKKSKNSNQKLSISSVRRYGHFLGGGTGRHMIANIVGTGRLMSCAISFYGIRKSETG